MPRGISKNPIETSRKISEAKKGKMPKNFYDIQKLAIIKNTGRKQSKEQIENRVKKNTGQKRTEETRKKMSEAQKGRIITEEHKQKISKIVSKTLIGNKRNLGNHLSLETRKKVSESHRGEKAYQWKGTTPLKQLIRQCFKMRQWICDVFQRDNYTCQHCGIRGTYLEAHHIKGFALIFDENNIKTLEDALNCEELWNINNGRTLCRNCHKGINKKEL